MKLFAALLITLLSTSLAWADRPLILASTTSSQNSGLYDHILPVFEAETGIRVNVVAVGTGQALLLGRNGDADVVIVHHAPSETAFVEAGFGVDRRPVMFNDFIVIGPEDDPAQVAGSGTALEAFRKIEQAKASFISRGDNSGTHLTERRMWLVLATDPSGPWYREIGAGMGAALNMASALGAYTLTDRGTWLSFQRKDGLGVVFEGDPNLHNAYSIIRVNPDRHPHVAAAAAITFVDWITGPAGQSAIASFQREGRPLFCPVDPTINAGELCER